MRCAYTGDPIALGQWEEVTEDQYWFALGAVPPLEMGRDWFILGEPQGLTLCGVQTYTLYIEGGGAYMRCLIAEGTHHRALASRPLEVMGGAR